MQIGAPINIKMFQIQKVYSFLLFSAKFYFIITILFI